MTYSDKLKDGRWQHKRLQILQAANFKCEECRDTNNLQVHHCCYIKGREPWEYDIDLLMCLCDECHESRQKQEDAIRVSLAKILRMLNQANMEKEAWNIISELSLRETERMAEAFS